MTGEVCLKVKLDDLNVGGRIDGKDYLELIIDKYPFKDKEYLTTLSENFLDRIVRGDKETPRILKKTYEIMEFKGLGDNLSNCLKLVNEICIMKKGEDLNEYERLSKLGDFED